MIAQWGQVSSLSQKHGSAIYGSQIRAPLPLGCISGMGLQQASHPKLLAWLRNIVVKNNGGPNQWIIRVKIISIKFVKDPPLPPH